MNMVDSHLLCPCGCWQGFKGQYPVLSAVECGVRDALVASVCQNLKSSLKLATLIIWRDKVRFIGDSPDTLNLIQLNSKRKVGTFMCTL